MTKNKKSNKSTGGSESTYYFIMGVAATIAVFGIKDHYKSQEQKNFFYNQKLAVIERLEDNLWYEENSEFTFEELKDNDDWTTIDKNKRLLKYKHNFDIKEIGFTPKDQIKRYLSGKTDEFWEYEISRKPDGRISSYTKSLTQNGELTYEDKVSYLWDNLNRFTGFVTTNAETGDTLAVAKVTYCNDKDRKIDMESIKDYKYRTLGKKAKYMYDTYESKNPAVAIITGAAGSSVAKNNYEFIDAKVPYKSRWKPLRR